MIWICSVVGFGVTEKLKVFSLSQIPTSPGAAWFSNWRVNGYTIIVLSYAKEKLQAISLNGVVLSGVTFKLKVWVVVLLVAIEAMVRGPVIVAWL